MTMQPLIPSLRPADLAGNYGFPASDYPVRLMTRRVYALAAAQICDARAAAPLRVSSQYGSGRSMRPPG